MPEIPLASTFVAPERNYRVRANPNMNDPIYEGQRAIARGVSDVANAGAEYAARINRAEYVAKSQSQDRNMKIAWDEYQKQLLTDKRDPQEWNKGWMEMSEKVMSQTDTKGLSDVQKAQIRQQGMDFTMQAGGQISLQAEKQRIENGQTAILSSAELDLKNGDLAGYESKINEGASVGFFDPKQQAQLIEQGKVGFDKNAANQAILDDPVSAYDALDAKTESGRWKNFGHISDADRRSFMVIARREASAMRTETLQGIETRLQQGEMVSSDDLTALVDKKLLTPTQKKWVEQRQGRMTESSELPGKFQQALRDVDAYQPSQDPEKTRLNELTGIRMQFPDRMATELKQRVDAKLKGEGDVRNGSPEVLKYIDNMKDGGFLGDIGMRPSTASKDPGKPRSPEQFRLAQEREVELKSALRDFLKKKPDASPVEQRDFINSKLTQQNTTNAALPMMNAISGKAQSSQKPQGKYKVIQISE